MIARNVAQPGARLVTILQPYIPAYRYPLFDHLEKYLTANGLELVVAHGSPRGASATRKNSVIGPWSQTLRSAGVSVGRSRFQARTSIRWARRSAVIVAELASTNLDTYLLALQRATPLMLWGHGRAAVTKENRLDRFLEVWLAKRAAHTLCYTDSGRVNLEKYGVARDRITVVQNSTDTRALSAEALGLSDAAVKVFREEHGITSTRAACFVGALDPSKRIDLILNASRLIAEQLADFQMIIAGDGPLRGVVEQRMKTQREIRLLPYADRRGLALIGRTSRIMLMPGRVGLIAADAMALGLPVITTDWPFHAPEREYLDAAFCDTVAQDPRQIADQIVRRLRDERWLELAGAQARSAALQLSVEATSRRMADAIVRVAGQGRPAILPQR